MKSVSFTFILLTGLLLASCATPDRQDAKASPSSKKPAASARAMMQNLR